MAGVAVHLWLLNFAAACVALLDGIIVFARHANLNLMGVCGGHLHSLSYTFPQFLYTDRLRDAAYA